MLIVTSVHVPLGGRNSQHQCTKDAGLRVKESQEGGRRFPATPGHWGDKSINMVHALILGGGKGRDGCSSGSDATSQKVTCVTIGAGEVFEFKIV